MTEEREVKEVRSILVPFVVGGLVGAGVALLLAPKAGTYEFHCDLFCGEGHEGMTGKIIAED